MIEIRRASSDDLLQAGAVLADAFHGYPWTTWTIEADNHEERIRQLQVAAMTHLGLPYGTIWLGVVNDVIRSVAVWMDSGIKIPAHASSEIEAIAATLEGTRHAASHDADEQLRNVRPTARHLLLGTVGTSRAFQGQGLGRLVLQPGIDQAELFGLPCYLETSSKSNVGFYESLAFRVRDHVKIHGDGPDVWSMEKVPSTAR